MAVTQDNLRPTVAALGAPPDEVISQLTSGLVRVSRRIEIYESDGVTPFDIPNWDARLIEGTISIDRERDERRSIDCLLDNTDRLLKNDPYAGFWYDKVLKAFWGIRYYDSVLQTWLRWETQVGEFMIDRLDEDRFPHAVKVTGRDYTKKCLNSKLAYSVSFPSGTMVEDIVKALALNAGITKFNLPITNQAYTNTLTFTRGTERWKVMQQVADTIAHEVYLMPDGSLTMQPYPDPTTSPIAWSFTQNAGGSLVSYTRSNNDSRIFNHIIVTGAALGSDPDNAPADLSQTDDQASEVVFAEALNTDPGSPTRIARIGERVMPPVESDLFTSVASAQAYADAQLRISSLEEYTMSFESLILPWLDGSDIVEIVEEDSSDYTPRRFLLSNISLPLGLGTMSGTARRVTIVGTTQTQEFM